VMNSIRRYIQNGQKDDIKAHDIIKDDFDNALKKILPSGSSDLDSDSTHRFRKRREEGNTKKTYIA